MTQYDKRNISMMMDFYEMTMANGYFKNGGNNTRVAFDVFYRKNPDNGGFAIFAGLEQIIEYVENMKFSEEDVKYFREQNIFDEEFLNYLKNFHFHGDIYAFPEGTIMYPNEPIITVVADLIDAQLIETAILAQVNHQSLIATKARRIVRAAEGRIVSDFGARRAHNMDAATYGARAAFIGGVNGTATVSAGQMFNIPVGGTMAHSWVMYFGDEFEAFKKYAEVYPQSTTLLVDTYDVIHSGIPNAIRIAKEILEPAGNRLKGIRIDSGDLAYLSKRVRKMLKFTITSLLNQGAEIDSFGVGERLITAKSEPVFGAVYKIVAIGDGENFIPRIKVSENVEKITNPGLKNVYRIYDENGHAVADMLALFDEEIDLSQPFRYIDPVKSWKQRKFTNCTAKKLLKLYVKDGKRVEELPKLHEIREYVKNQLANEIWDEEQRFENPHHHYLDMSPNYYEMKMNLLYKTRSQMNE